MGQFAESKEFAPIWADIENLYLTDGRPDVLCDALVERQSVEYGANVSEPCVEAVELIEQWQADCDADFEDGGEEIDWMDEWHAAAARAASEVTEFRKAVDAQNPEPPHAAFDPNAIEWNQAAMSGTPCEAWRCLMNRQLFCSFGFVESAKSRDDTQKGAWKPSPMTAFHFFEGSDCTRGRPAWGLSRHVADKHKGGAGFVLGACQTYRRAETIKTVDAIGLDFDTGHLTYEDAVERACELGFAFGSYTSFNHLTTVTELKFDAVVKHAKCEGEPSLDQIRAYVAEKKSLAPRIVQSIEVDAMRDHTKDGLVIRLRHAPIPKFRMVFLLKETVTVAELANTLSGAQDIHRRKVLGLAEMIGAPTDLSTLDLSRFFFSARHCEGAEHHVFIHRAPPIAYEDIPLAKEQREVKRRNKRRPDVVVETCDGRAVDVSALYDSYAKRWALADIAEHAGLQTSAYALNVGGKFHVRCAFSDGHTNSADDGATFAINAEDAETAFANVKCLHSSCQGRHAVDHLGAWIESGDLDPAVLEDPEFMLEFADDQDEERYFRLTPEETKGEAEARAFLRGHIQQVEGRKVIADSAQDGAVRLLEEMGVDEAIARQRVEDAISDIERQLEGLLADKQSDPVAEAKAEATGEIEVPSVLEPTFDERLVDAEGFIYQPNDRPKLYREFGIKPNDERAFEKMQAEIRDQMYQNMAARFDYVVLDNDAKLAIAQPQGVRPKLWSERTPERLYRNRTAKYWGGTAKNPKVIEIKPGEVFLSARERPTFLDTCFEPNPKRAALAAQRGAFNLWNGFAVTGKAGDWSKLRDHALHVLCSGNQDHFDWFMTKQASLFSRPGVKVPSSVAIFGQQGTGKSKFYDWLRQGIGSAALKVSSGRHLTGNFNAHLDGIILLVCEEAFWGGNKADGGIIKDIVGSETLQIEGKFQNVVERPNYVNIDFISNNKWIVPVDGEDARRFFVLECSNAHKQDAAYFGAIDDQMENGGLQAMVHELMHWDPSCIGGWEMLRYPPITDCLRQQAGMGLRGPAERLVVVLEDCILQGRTADGDAFYYELQEDIETPTARNHVVSALSGGEGRGNLSQEMKDALETFLGPDADKGDNNKSVIEYLGETRFEHDAEGKPIGEKRAEKVTNGRVRQVVFPPMKDIRSTLRKYGRG